MTGGSDTSVILALAVIGHRLWCEHAKAQGWTSGPVFDPVAKIHDQLVPFDKLLPADQEATCMAVEAQEISRRLLAAIETERAADRPLRREELRVGLRVGWASGILPSSKQANGAPLVGEVQAWEVDAARGDLKLVRVLWPDGRLTEHDPEERDLERAGPGLV